VTRAVLVTLVALAGLANPLPGRAGDFHVGPTLICSDCHTMHFSEAHTLTGAIPEPGSLGAYPQPALLRHAAAELCLSCHDGKTYAPDVYGDHGNAYVRAAGQLSKMSDPEATRARGHTIGDTRTAPGGSWSSPVGLRCQHCHASHGNAYYRNLLPQPGTAAAPTPVTYVTGAYDDAAAVQLLAGGAMSTRYAATNVRYRRTATATASGLSAWCAGCHTTVHGAGGAPHMGGSVAGDTGPGARWLQHPTRDVTMQQAAANGHVDLAHWAPGGLVSADQRVPVVSPNGAVPGGDNEVFCGSCHRAHGSTERKGLIFVDAATSEPEGGSSLRETCQQCHYK
jgi:hypothetical protein